MADPISVQCPHCKAKLKLKAAPPEGKKIGCPKCKKPFPVKAPPKKKADEDDFLDALDDLAEDDYEAPEDENSEEQEEEAPARSTKRSSGGVSKKGAVKAKKGRSKKKSAGPLLAIIGGSVAAVLLLGGLVWFLMNLPGATGIRSASGEFIAFLPSDADVYFTARPADLIASPVLASLVQNPEGQKGLADFEKSFGFPAQEIEHLFLAVKLDPNAAKPAAQPGAPMAGNPMAGNPMMGLPGMPGGMGMGMPGGNQAGVEDAVIVIRLKQPYGGKTLTQVTQGFTAKSHSGISYYVDPKPNGGAIVFASDRYAILSEPKWIERIIDRKDQAENNDLLAYLAKDQHLTMIANSKGTATQPSFPSGFSPEMLPSKEMQKLVQEIASVRLDLKFPGSVDLKVALTCKTDSAAQQVHTETTKQVEQLKQGAAGLSMMLPGIDAVINSVQVNLTGSTMSVSASVPSAMIDRVKEMAGPPGGSPPPLSPGAAFPGSAQPGAFPAGFPGGASAPGAVPPAAVPGVVPPGLPAGVIPPGTAIPPGAVPPAGAIPPAAPKP